MAKKYISLSRLSTFLDNLKTTFAAISHKHTVSDLTDYVVDTELSSTSTNPVQNNVIDAEFEAIGNAMGALELAIDGKVDASHDHNNLYYTEIEVDEKLNEAKEDASNKDAFVLYEAQQGINNAIESAKIYIDSAVAEKTQVQMIESDETEILSALKIYKMTQDQYDEEVANGTIDENALYLTPDDGADLNDYVTAEQLNTKADIEHKHKISDVTDLETALGNKSDVSHTHSKEDIGLGNVENKSSATIRGEITKENIIEALGYTPSATDTVYSAITDEEIDEICSGGLTDFLEEISSEGECF